MEEFQSIEQLREELEKILRAHQVTLQQFANEVDRHHGHVDASTYVKMLDLSDLALQEKENLGKLLTQVKTAPTLRLVQKAS